MGYKTPFACAASLCLWATSANAAAECYDVKIWARPVDQVPSEIGDCGGDCIIMSWPWFLDLKIKRVIEGKVDSKMVRVLTVQHTYLKPRHGTWQLRRNTAGGYNVLLREDREAAGLCAPNANPVDPYIRVESGRTLDAARDLGVNTYGHHRD